MYYQQERIAVWNAVHDHFCLVLNFIHSAVSYITIIPALVY